MVSLHTGNIRSRLTEKAPVGKSEEEKLNWLRQILEWQRDMSDNKEFMSLLKNDLDLLRTVFTVLLHREMLKHFQVVLHRWILHTVFTVQSEIRW